MAAITELEAVNEILDAVNIPSVDAVPTSDDGSDEWLAQVQLDASTKDVLAYGWAFNTDIETTLSPSGGQITLAADVLRFEAQLSWKYIEREGKVYDRANNSFTITQDVVAQKLVKLFTFTECSEALQRYILSHARLKFARRNPQTIVIDQLTRELVESRGNAFEQDARESNTNPTNTARHRRLMGRRGVGGIWGGY